VIKKVVAQTTRPVMRGGRVVTQRKEGTTIPHRTEEEKGSKQREMKTNQAILKTLINIEKNDASSRKRVKRKEAKEHRRVNHTRG